MTDPVVTSEQSTTETVGGGGGKDPGSVGGARGPGFVATVLHTVHVRGAWLLSKELDEMAVVLGHDDQEAKDAEAAETIFPEGRTPVRVTGGSIGQQGRVTGFMAENDLGGEFRHAEEWRNALRRIKADATDTRLAYVHENIRVILGELELPVLAPSDPPQFGVSIEWWQRKIADAIPDEDEEPPVPPKPKPPGGKTA